ncbi:hypothetical protein SDC9_156241 [bioreactor metagenome]|uniref:Uncharacterized protein n=1 Tax=bioreactor metagenome TaxID=1076179 RepID=A0A645F913_9ZZZZ
MFAVHAGVGRQDVEHHGAALGAADQRHHVIHPPAHDVGQRAVLALGDADDAVANPELGRACCRSARDQFADDDEVVTLLQHCADADQ